MSSGEEPSGGRLTRSGSDGDRGVDPEGAIVLAPREGRARSCSVSRQRQHPQQSIIRQQQQQVSPQSGTTDQSATATNKSKSKKQSSSDTSQGSSHRHRLVANDGNAASVPRTRSKTRTRESSASVTRKGSSCRQRLGDDNTISSVSAAPKTQSKIKKKALCNDGEGSNNVKHLADGDAAASTHNDSWSGAMYADPNKRKGSTRRQQLSVQDNASFSSISVREKTTTTNNNVVEIDDDYSNSQGLGVDNHKPKSKPAFPGAKFDAQGYCIYHPSMRLQERRFDKWHIFHNHCPKCRGSSIGDRKGKEKRDRGSSRGSATGDTRSGNKIIEKVEDRRGRSLSRMQSLSRGVVRSVSKTHHGNDEFTSSLERGGVRDMNERDKVVGKVRLSNRFNLSDKGNNDIGSASHRPVDENGAIWGGNSVASSNSFNDDVRKIVDHGSNCSSSRNMSAEITAIVPKSSPSCDDSNDHDNGRRSSSWRRRNYCQSISTRSVSPLPTPGNRSRSRRRVNSIGASFDRCRRSPSAKVRNASSFDSQSSFRRDGRSRSYTRSSSPSFSSLSPSHRSGNRKSSNHRDGNLPPPREQRRNHNQRNYQSSPMSSRGSLSGSSRHSNHHRNRRLSKNAASVMHRTKGSLSPYTRRRSREHRNSFSPSVRSLGSSTSRRSANRRRSRLEPPKRSCSRVRAVSADRRRGGRQHRPVRSHSQVSNRRSMSRGRPMSHGRQGGRRSNSHGPIGADSYALVVRERTPSPNNRNAPSRHRSSSRRPPVENQLVERHRHNSLTPSPAKSRRYRDHSSPRSKLRPQSSGTRRRRNGTVRSKSPSRRPTRAQSRPLSRSSVKSRSRSTTPEIWIVCPKTEDDPFDNSFATFEEWDLSPQAHSKQQTLSPAALSALTDSGRDKKSLGRMHPLAKETKGGRLLFLDKQDSFDYVPPMTPPLSMRHNSSFNSLQGAGGPKRRVNSLERKLPEWSELNVQTRSKAANLSMLSQQISSMSRRDSRTRTGSSGMQMSETKFRSEQHDSLGIFLPTSMNQSKSYNSMEEGAAPLRSTKSIEQSLPDPSDNKFRTRTKVADLLMLSQEISTLSRRELHARSVSTGRGHVNGRQIGDSERKVLERGMPGMRYSFGDTQPKLERENPGMSQVEMALAIIEETQGKKLPRWNNKPESKMVSSRGMGFSSTVAPSPTSQRQSESMSAALSRSAMVASTSRSKSPAGLVRRNSKSMELSSNFTRRVNDPAGERDFSPKQHPLAQDNERKACSPSVNYERQKEQSKVDDHEQSPRRHSLRQAPIAPRRDGSNHVNSLKVAERSSKEQRRGDYAGQSVSSSKVSREPCKETKVAGERKNDRPPADRSVTPGVISPDKNAAGRKSTMFGREPRKINEKNVRRNCRSVKNMPFTDQFGETGMYTGQVNEDCRPDGKGSMKYENGVYYEGLWSNGCQDENAASQYGRIRGGFTGWSGKGKEASRSGMTMPWNARKSDAHDPYEKINVRGMEWSDISGQSGRYTGEVNKDRIPHGRGMMKYDYGLIADGRWVNGVLDEGPQDRMIIATASMGTRTVASTLSMGPMSAGPGLSVGPGMSIGPGMSLGPAISVGAGMSVGPGMSSVGPGSVIRMQGPAFPMGHMTTIGSMPTIQHTPVQFVNFNPMLAAEQNAMMTMHGGGSNMYRPPIMGMPMTIQPPAQILLPQTALQQEQSDKPPISEIKINAET